jgi:hypothetical protein
MYFYATKARCIFVVSKVGHNQNTPLRTKKIKNMSTNFIKTAGTTLALLWAMVFVVSAGYAQNLCNANFNYQVNELTVTFNNESIAGNVPMTSTLWNFGDSTTATTYDAAHTYTEAGIYEVCVYGTGVPTPGTICSDMYCSSVIVGNPCGAYTMPYTLSTSGVFQGTLQIAGLSLPNSTLVRWHLAGSPTALSTTHDLFYQFAPGTYTICADTKLNNLYCENAVCTTITLGENTNPCTYQIVETNNNGTDFTFYLTTTDSTNIIPSNITWILEGGGGQIGTGNGIHYTFGAPGVYVVCALFTSPTCTSTFICKDIIVGNSCPQVSMVYDILNDSLINVSLVAASGQVLTNSQIIWYHNGITMGAGNPITIFAAPNTTSQYICAEYWTADQCHGYLCDTIYTGGGGCLQGVISHTNTNTGAILTLSVPNDYIVKWRYDGANTYIGTGNPFTFDVNGQPGTYHICADYALPDGSCLSHTCTTIVIATDTITTCDDYHIAVANQNNHFVFNLLPQPDSINDVHWFIPNGGGLIGQGSTLAYTFPPQNATYTVCAEFGNPATGLGCNICQLVTVNMTPDTLCTPYFEVEMLSAFEAVLYPTSSSPNSGYIWSINGQQMTSTGGLTYTFPFVGTYQVCLSTPNCAAEYCRLVFISGQIDSTCTSTDCVFPGDADYNQEANNFDLLAIGHAFGYQGAARTNASNNWAAQSANDWTGTQTDGTNFKHSDCDGDGSVGFSDVTALELNYLKHHNGVIGLKGMTTPDGTPIYLQFSVDSVFISNQVPSIAVSANIMMGTLDAPANDVYGVAFSVGYPAALVQDSVHAAFDNDEWFGDEQNTIRITKVLPELNRIDMAISRINHQNVSGYGQIGSVEFTITDDIIGFQKEGVKTLPFVVQNIRLINSEGNEIPVNGLSTSIVVIENATSAAHNLLDDAVKIMPNPTKGTLYLQTEGSVQVQTITITDILGKQVFHEAIQGNTIELGELANGVYIATLVTNQGVVVRKITKTN